MKIGLDLDNTIVCYDQAIEKLTNELLDVPKEIPRTKLGIRDFLRVAGREAEWTAFQAELYGPGMQLAEPFEGAINTMQGLIADGHELSIISHRSRRPYAGPDYDLHAAAGKWIDNRLRGASLFSGHDSEVNFLETFGEKIRCISDQKCEAFVDDLTDVLMAPEFPMMTEGILFDPEDTKSTPTGCSRITSWSELILMTTVMR